MHDLSRFRALAERYREQADFVVVYIEEAHPSDGWVTGGANPLVPTHRSMRERIAAAQQMQQLGALPSYVEVYVDLMDDAANRAYGALFERLYVLQGGRVAYQGGRGPSDYRMDEVAAWLATAFPSVA